MSLIIPCFTLTEDKSGAILIIFNFYMMLWQLFALWQACFHGNTVLAHTNVSTPETTLAPIFEQFTLQNEQQNAGMHPELTVQNIHQIHGELTS